jgi:uncharacterized DUF497 family protein
VAEIEWDAAAVAHMRDRHGVTPTEAEEAIDDPDALVQSPDPASKSGKSDRYIGWSDSQGEVIVVIVVRHNGKLYGGNAWTANGAHRNLYEGRRDNE